jgi:hypothetical protein
MLAAMLLLAAVVPARSEQGGESLVPKAKDSEGTREYFDARGRLIGSVTKIGGVTFFNDPDGKLIGTAETVEGRRIYKSY